MSLDATILEVERDGADVVLTLGPRIDNDDRLTLAGQDRMRILEATFVPEPGMDLWGGDFHRGTLLHAQAALSPRRLYAAPRVGGWTL